MGGGRRLSLDNRAVVHPVKESGLMRRSFPSWIPGLRGEDDKKRAGNDLTNGLYSLIIIV
jgi:hypothetical protein